MSTEQHDFHCRLTFMGYNWWIVRVRPRHLVDVWRPVGFGHCYTVATIDIADVDFDAYCEMAAAWDAARERA